MKGAETKIMVAITMIIIAILIMMFIIAYLLDVDVSSIFPQGVFW